MSTEDRSKLPDGLWRWDPDEAADDPAANAAAWAFVDRIRQEAAAAERERIAAIVERDGAPGRLGLEREHEQSGYEDSVTYDAIDARLVADWLRSGAKGEP